MSTLPQDFATSYNGYVFDPDTTVTTALKIRPVETSDGRSIAYNEITLGLRTIIRGQPTDSFVRAARMRLTKSGGALFYGGRGVGPIWINTSLVKDVKFGPKPKVLALQPMGHRNACQLDWEVTTCIPECGDARYQFTAMDLSFKVEFRIRADGAQDRVVAGELMIPNNRLVPGSVKIRDSVDYYRDKIPTPLAVGFRREWSPFQVDESRSKMAFGWTDKEFGRNVYPVGVVACDANHDIQSETGIGVKWSGSLTANYTMAVGTKPQIAERHFAKLIENRVRKSAKKYGGSIIPLKYRFSEPNIYGDEAKCGFSFQYMLIGFNGDLGKILELSGLYSRTDDNWSSWAASLSSSALNPRGASKLVFSTNEDQIVDLCSRGTMGPAGPGVTCTGFPGPVVDPPTADRSWILYRNFVVVEGESGLVSSRTLSNKGGTDSVKGGFETELVGNRNPVGWLMRNGSSGGKEMFDKKPTPQEFLKAFAEIAGSATSPGIRPRAGGARPQSDPPRQGIITSEPERDVRFARRTPGCVVVYMCGYALRAGFAIPCPSLGKVNGVEPKSANRKDKGEGFATGIVSNGLIPIVGAKWRLRYELPSIPEGGIQPPPDPT